MHIKNDGLLVDDSLLFELGTENPDALLLIKKINQIDLEPIKKRFVIKKRWQESSADLAIKEYRQFLFDCYTSKEPKSPSKLVDEVWHDHILHTKKYAEDCQKILESLSTTHQTVRCVGLKDHLVVVVMVLHLDGILNLI